MRDRRPPYPREPVPNPVNAMERSFNLELIQTRGFALRHVDGMGLYRVVSRDGWDSLSWREDHPDADCLRPF